MFCSLSLWFCFLARRTFNILQTFHVLFSLSLSRSLESLQSNFAVCFFGILEISVAGLSAFSFFSLKCKSRWQNELSERVKQKVETVQQYKQVRKRERKKLQRNLRIFFENEKREMRRKLKILKKVQFYREKYYI